MRYFDIILENISQIPWNKNPQIGWWLDNDPVTFYHGTHKKNLPFILENGIVAPTIGPTAGWISLALEPNTAWGYASMSGGESAFRAAGTKAFHVPPEDRVVLVLQIPQRIFLPKMAPQRGASSVERNKLTDKEKYIAWHKRSKTDQEYYALTEIRLPEKLDRKHIKAIMKNK